MISAIGAADSIAPAGDEYDHLAAVAVDEAGTAQTQLAADRLAVEGVMRDDLAETARDQVDATLGVAGHQGTSRGHVFSHARHERAAIKQLAHAEKHHDALAAKAKHALTVAKAQHHAAIRHRFAGHGVALHATPEAAAAIAAGEHQIPVVDGVPLEFPSQNLGMIESTTPNERGQTHGLTKHVGKTLADNVARLREEPHIRAAGGYFDSASAQGATDRTIGNPANQAFIRDFLADPGRTKAALRRVDLGADVGASTLRADLDAGRPSLVNSHTATVVLIKDPTFPEGYRTLTTYPDAGRAPEVDAEGKRTT